MKRQRSFDRKQEHKIIAGSVPSSTSKEVMASVSGSGLTSSQAQAQNIQLSQNALVAAYLASQQQQPVTNALQNDKFCVPASASFNSLPQDHLAVMLRQVQEAGASLASSTPGHATVVTPAPDVPTIPQLPVLAGSLNAASSQPNPVGAYINLFARAAAAATTQAQKQQQHISQPSQQSQTSSVGHSVVSATSPVPSIAITPPSVVQHKVPDLSALLQQHQVALAQQNVVAAAAHQQQQQQKHQQHQQQQQKQQNLAVAAQAAAAQMSMSAVVAQQASLSVQRAVQGGSIHKWKIEEIESHIQLLRDAGRPIPNQLQLVLEEARRREHKKTAKRVANRKSACTSRARKKALVEEMTRTNARLKRQAQILSLLPDLVMATTVDGTITFSSAQVENVLRYDADDLMDVKFETLVVPRSKEVFHGLVSKLVASMSDRSGAPVVPVPPVAGDSGDDSDAAIVSEQSFPPIAMVTASGDGKDGGPSSVSTGSTQTTVPAPAAPAGRQSKCKSPSNGASLSPGSPAVSPISSDNENFRASKALNRNVESHNARFRASLSAQNGHKDDVLGAAVTANNADARLSSLQHVPGSVMAGNETPPPPVAESVMKTPPENCPTKKSLRKNGDGDMDDALSSSSDSLHRGVEPSQAKRRRLGNRLGDSSDDSGYREGSEGLPSGEYGVYSEDSLSEGCRARQFAPTCSICMIRSDRTTVWCEVTSSIRTRCLKTEADDAISPLDKPLQKVGKGSFLPCEEEPPQETIMMKELLLCLRPIREGEQGLPESAMQVKKPAETAEKAVQQVTSSSANTGSGSSLSDNSLRDGSGDKKKSAGERTVLRKYNKEERRTIDSPSKFGSTSSIPTDTEKSVVESLMLMSNPK
eukprot:CAMPEP_0194279014 /NCGR_PEP_ID=MMETSP0169-20130528/13005_1 /TAXON_ID=218684 /ORGANISM="Corethron pennatum, Strain L29A3" /LENGTH=870 /DNA_ID=CAMNT_0039023357 /DNA_START=292 /DNA_END=2904 /DNA_ORIENTATION=+